jgi:myo-inositol-1(or 4)-monophosphatase
MHPFLNTAIKAARRAGMLILRNLNRIDRINVQEKSRRDFVSDVDKMAETEIIDIIQYMYPGHAILGEESGSHAGEEYQWIIDPLDGTTNFLHGYPQFCVSIAVRKEKHIEHAVIFDPLSDELYAASRGQGARLNDRRIRVSKVRSLDGALLASGIPFSQLHHFDAYLSVYRSLVTRSSGIRRSGSTALNLAWLASGRVDGLWVVGNKAWDVAAGSLLIQEAGGLMSDFDGGDNYIDGGALIAANPEIFEELQGIVGKYLNRSVLSSKG